MTQEQIKNLMNRGLITEVISTSDLENMTEKDLLDKGYITQVAVLDGKEETVEEVLTPVIDEAPEVETEEEETNTKSGEEVSSAEEDESPEVETEEEE